MYFNNAAVNKNSNLSHTTIVFDVLFNVAVNKNTNLSHSAILFNVL